MRQTAATAGSGAGPTDFPSDLSVPSTWYYAAPPPLGNDANDGLTAATPKTLKRMIADAPSGSGIWLLDGRYSSAVGYNTRPDNGLIDNNYDLPNKTLTIWAVNRGDWEDDPLGDGSPYAPRFERKVIIDGLWQFKAGRNYTFGYVAFTARDCFSGWPDQTLGETWYDKGLGSDVNYNTPLLRGETGSLRLYRCEAYHGYGVSQVEYNPATKYPEFNSPATWYFRADNPRRITNNPADGTGGGTNPQVGHGDAIWSTYNTIVWGPGFTGKRWASLRIEECYIHDMATMMGATISSSMLILRNWFARTAFDFLQTHADVFNYSQFVVQGNIIQDPFGNPLDCGNPHGDTHQDFSTAVGGTVSAPQLAPLRETNNNLVFYTPGCRGKSQGLFYQNSFDQQVTVKVAYTGMKVRNNIMLGVYKGYLDQGSKDLYYRNNIAVNPYGFTSSGNAQSADFVARRRLTVSGVLRVDAGPSKGLFYGNIVESLGGDAEFGRTNSVSTGYQGSSVSNFATVFTDMTDGKTTAQAWWTALQRLPAYAAMGPQYATLRDFLNQPLDWTGERPWVGFLDMTSQPLSTLITANASMIHGGDNGDTLALTGFPSTAQWRMLDTDGTTELITWSNSATGTLVVGKLMQVRQTTPGTNSTPSTVNFSVAGYPMSWAVTTVSSNFFPETTFAGTARLRALNTTSMGLADSKTVWFYFRGRPAASQSGVLAFLAAGFTGTAMFGAITLGTNNKIAFTFRNQAGTIVVTSGTVTAAITRDGTALAEFLVAVDTSQASYDTGVQVYQRVDGGSWTSIKQTAPPTYVQDGLINFSLSDPSGARNIYFLGNSSSYYEGEFQALAFGTGALDITDPAIREIFSADNIGELAKGPNGIQPYWWFVGKKTLIEGANANLSTAVNARAVTKDGAGTLTAGTHQTWPVPLGTRFVLSPGPYPVGVPLTVTLVPLGYISPGSSTTISLAAGSGTFDNATKSIPEGLGGVSFTFTPSATGTTTFNATAPGIHGAPVAASITVV